MYFSVLGFGLGGSHDGLIRGRLSLPERYETTQSKQERHNCFYDSPGPAGFIRAEFIISSE